MEHSKINRNNNENLETAIKRVTTPKAPPIYVEEVGIIGPLKEVIDAIAKDRYSFKILNNEKVKIQPHSAEDYTPIFEELKKRNTLCCTYQLKQERNFKVVLRGLHHSLRTEKQL